MRHFDPLTEQLKSLAQWSEIQKYPAGTILVALTYADGTRDVHEIPPELSLEVGFEEPRRVIGFEIIRRISAETEQRLKEQDEARRAMRSV